MKDNTIVKLSDRDHILLRPSMYVGSVDFVTKEEYIFEAAKFVKKSVTYIPGLIKIVNEIIDNSVDEAVRTDYQFSNKIKVTLEDLFVKIEDNGRGIPVKLIENSEHYMPVVAFCEVRAGSNFDDDDDRSTIGMNGVGASLTNIYSNRFNVETSDGENKLSLVCTDNMKTIDFSIHKNSCQFTQVSFYPDFSKFAVDRITSDHKAIIKQRLAFLSISHPEIKFYFNKERISLGSEKNFMSMFSDTFEVLSGPSWFIGVFPSEEDDFSYFTYVNGLHIKSGGNHVSLVSNELINRIRNKLSKKYKTIKPGDIKNKLSFVVFFKDFKNMKFDSQTKENITNSVSEIRDYLNVSIESWDNFGKKILRNENLIEPIIEFFRIKEEFKKKQELKKVSSVTKKVSSEKYFAPIGEKKYLFLAEGDSAVSGIQPVFGRQGIGYFALRGKPLNTYDTQILKLIANQEIKTIIDILNLDLTNSDTDMDFEKVIFASDQDADGNHIRSLLLTFFNRFTPRMIEEGRICFINTPLIVGKKKGKIKEWYFDFDSYKKNTLKDNFEWKYFKGLGTWKKEELQEIIDNLGGFKNLLVAFQKTELSNESLKIWMKNSEADQRKEKLFGKQFNISTV